MASFSSTGQLLRQPEGLAWHGGAAAYAVTGYAVGFAGLFHASWLINIPAIFLLAHAMIVAAYMIHECGHNLVFNSIRHNAMLGRIMSSLCGADYGTYEDMRYKHFRHHVDIDDAVWFDYEKFFAERPYVLRMTQVLEWFYIPAHDLIMHFIMVFASFIIPQRKSQRRRNVTVMRKGDFAWEQEHTYSNPHSLDHEWVNWLTLNFGFHNAHHDDMSIPWYRLPVRHRELFGNDPATVIPFSAQLRIFHKQRVRRIVGNHDDESPTGKDFLRAAQQAEVYGGNAASFLTSF
jgi:fatty acid desaturase